MRTRINTIKSRCNSFLVQKGIPIGTMMTTAGTMMMMTMAHADAAGDLLQFIIDVIGKLILALAVIMAVLGLVGWAQANSEGDGPALNKAKMQLAAAIMLVVLSIILIASKSTLAGMLTTS